jgi:hypothetical protein
MFIQKFIQLNFSLNSADFLGTFAKLRKAYIRFVTSVLMPSSTACGSTWFRIFIIHLNPGSMYSCDHRNKSLCFLATHNRSTFFCFHSADGKKKFATLASCLDFRLKYAGLRWVHYAKSIASLIPSAIMVDLTHFCHIFMSPASWWVASTFTV